MTQPVSRMYVSYLERYVSELLSHHSTFHQDCSYHAQCQATPYQTTAEPPPRQTEQHQPYLAENVPGPTPTTSGDASLVPGRSKGAPILRGLLQDTGRSTTTHLQSASSQELNNSRQQQTSLVPSQSNRVSVLRGLPQDTGRSTKTHLRSAGSQEPIDSRQQQTSPELRIIEYKPTKVPRNRGREKWRAKADELIRETPPADVWWDNISALGLEGAQALAETVLEFNNSDWMWAFPQRSVEQTDNQKHPLVKVLERYAWFAGNGHRIKFCIFELINLRQLVLLGACFVLSQVGVPKEALIEVTRICFPEVTDRYVMELWRAGAFVYQLAEKLALAGWGGRAHYLHLLWNRSPQSYHVFNSSPAAALDYITARLSVEKYTRNVESCQNWTPIFLPYLICKVLQDKLHITRISYHLYYTHTEILNPELADIPINPWRYFMYQE